MARVSKNIIFKIIFCLFAAASINTDDLSARGFRGGFRGGGGRSFGRSGRSFGRSGRSFGGSRGGWRRSGGWGRRHRGWGWGLGLGLGLAALTVGLLSRDYYLLDEPILLDANSDGFGAYFVQTDDGWVRISEPFEMRAGQRYSSRLPCLRNGNCDGVFLVTTRDRGALLRPIGRRWPRGYVSFGVPFLRSKCRGGLAFGIRW